MFAAWDGVDRRTSDSPISTSAGEEIEGREVWEGSILVLLRVSPAESKFECRSLHGGSHLHVLPVHDSLC